MICEQIFTNSIKLPLLQLSLYHFIALYHTSTVMVNGGYKMKAAIFILFILLKQ